MADIASAVRVHETTESTNSPYQLQGAATTQRNLRSFVGAGVDSKEVFIMESHQELDNEWQLSRAVVTNGSPDTYTINRVIASHTGSQMGWSSGKRDVFLVDPHGYSPGPQHTVTGDTTLDETYFEVIGNFSTLKTVTLPPVAQYQGKVYWFKSIGSATMKIAEDSGDSNTLEGPSGTFGTALNLTTAGQWLQLRSDGTKWRRIGAHGMSIAGEVVAGVSGSILYVDANGDLAQDNSNLYYDATLKRIGIGTMSPNRQLHIESTGAIPSEIDLVKKTATSNLTDIGQINFYNSTANQVAEISSGDFGATDSGNLSLFTRESGGSLTRRLHIASDGQIFIGDGTIPAAQVDIDNQIAADPGLIVRGASGQSDDIVKIVDVNGAEWVVIDSDGRIGQEMGAATPTARLHQIIPNLNHVGHLIKAAVSQAADIVQYHDSNDTVQYVIDASFNLGLGGVTAPASILHVESDPANSPDDAKALALVNSTAAVANVSGDDGQSYSPSIRWEGQGWKTNATAASQSVEFRQYVQPVQGTSAPTGNLLLESSINGGAYSSLVSVNSAGNIGIGTPSQLTKLHVATTSASSPRGIMSAQHTTDTEGARLHLRKSRGSESSPTFVVSGDNLGRLVASGHDGSNYLEMGALEFQSEGTIAATRVPTRFSIYTATDATPSVLTERVRVGNLGRVRIGFNGNPVGNEGLVMHHSGNQSATFRATGATNYADVRLYNDQNSGVRACAMAYTGSTWSGTFVTSGPTGEQGAIGTTGSFPLSIYTNSIARVTITGAGVFGFVDAVNMSFGTTTGTKIGTATSQKIGFYNATPIVQPTTGVAEAAFVENAGGTAVNVDSTFGGYTLQQIAQALQNLGLVA